jgi:predicted nicotinamide N-methyase
MTTVTEAIDIGGARFVLERPAEPESLIDEDAFADDEFLPYWAERWPSGIALAEHVAARDDLRGRRALEIGCGLGLPSLVAARLGADVVATDWSPDAIALLGRNASRNGLRVTAAPADWRDTDTIGSLGPFDLVLAADVLYEARNAAPILTLLTTLGAPVTIADPGRRHAAGFLDAVRADGWGIDTMTDARIPQGGIHRLSRVRPS